MEQQESKLDNSLRIEEIITKSLKEMGKIYELATLDNLKLDKENTFSDATSKQGLINTAEALECFFIPYFYVKGIREKFWNGELINLDHIKKSIIYIISDSITNDPDNDGTLKLSGTPYINFKINDETKESSKIEKNLDFLDCGCFVLNALLDAKAISKEREQLINIGIIKKNSKYATNELIPEKFIEKLDKRIYDAAKLIKECDLGEGKGWAFTNEKEETRKEDQLYFTWNALETIEALMIYMNKAPEIIPQQLFDLWGGKSKALENLKTILFQKRIFLTSKFLSNDNPKLNIAGNQKVDFGEEDTSYYYNLFALISLLICGCEDTVVINKSFEYLINVVYNPKIWQSIRDEKHGEFPIAGSLWENHHRQNWKERAFKALLTKALARYREANESRFVEMVRPTGKNVTEVFNKFFDDLLSERETISLNNGEIFSNIWDNNKKYSIYFTERVIEALVRLYSVISGEFVKPYYNIKEVGTLTTVNENEVLSKGSPVTYHINIDKDIISKELLKAIEEEIHPMIQNKINEFFNSEFLTEQIKKEIKETLIPSFFSSVGASLRNAKNKGKTDKDMIKFSDTLSQIMGELMVKSFIYKIQSIGDKEKYKLNPEDFSKRFEAGLGQIALWEDKGEDKEGLPVDYRKIFNDIIGAWRSSI